MLRRPKRKLTRIVREECRRLTNAIIQKITIIAQVRKRLRTSVRRMETEMRMFVCRDWRKRISAILHKQRNLIIARVEIRLTMFVPRMINVGQVLRMMIIVRQIMD